MAEGVLSRKTPTEEEAEHLAAESVPRRPRGGAAGGVGDRRQLVSWPSFSLSEPNTDRGQSHGQQCHGQRREVGIGEDGPPGPPR